MSCVLVVGAVSIACAPRPDGPDATIVLSGTCADAGTAAIHFGTAEPARLPLTFGQRSAVARVDLGTACSGIVVAPRWVLTARHCAAATSDSEPPGAEVLVGAGAVPDRRIPVARIVRHGVLDLALLELGLDARDVMPELEPVPIVTFTLSALVGELAEAAGYGQREDGERGERRFFAAPIESVLGDVLTVDGMGRAGTCFGDSGGPLLVVGAGGARVAGISSVGDPSCVGRSRFVRLDIARGWVESHTGAAPPDDPGCRDVTADGMCLGSTALRCVGDALRVDVCDMGETCSILAGVAACLPECPR